MTQFILTDVFLLAVGAMLYLAARTLPRISPDGAPEEEEKRSAFERLVMSDIPHRVDAATSYYIGKLFRRLKIVLLRFDNYLTERLKKLHTEGALRDKKIDLSEIAGTNGAGEGGGGEEAVPLPETPSAEEKP